MRAIGCSNFSAEQLAEADRVAREQGTARFTVLQNEYNLLRRDDDEDVLPLCRELGIGYVPYFPLASGLLTGKYRPRRARARGDAALRARTIDDERFAPVEALARFASGHGHTLLDLAISALASTPGIDIGHRRRDEARAGARERRGRPLAPGRGPAPGARRRLDG